MNKLIFTYILLVFFNADNCFSQKLNKDLEEKIFELNNAFKYKESQKILLDIINNSHLTNEKFEACILLSNTYKRVFDYVSTKKYLEEATAYASTTEEKNRLQCLKAMFFFDTNDYKTSKEIMLTLEKVSFNGINNYEVAILLMQIGYIFYSEKDYLSAKAYYNKSLNMMDISPNNCDYPLVYGKMFALFKEEKATDSIESLFKKGMLIAEKCNILKYKLYLIEEYIKVMDDDNYEKKITLQKKLDSIRELYAPMQKTSELLNSKEEIVTNKLKREKDTSVRYYSIISIFLLLFSFIAFFLYRKTHSEKKNVEKENLQIKEELSIHIEKTKSNKKKLTQLYADNKLTTQQKKVLDLVMEGFINKQISEKLYISENTVKYHIKNIYKILQKNEMEMERKDFLS